MIEIEKPKIECVEDPANGTYGKFTVEPLERGYGITLGNALRRIMLSSLPGTAATSIKIAGVQHEFSTIPGVKEDVTEIVLNVKSLITRLHNTDGIKTVYIEAVGPCEVKAGDIKASPIPALAWTSPETTAARFSPRIGVIAPMMMPKQRPVVPKGSKSPKKNNRVSVLVQKGVATNPMTVQTMPTMMTKEWDFLKARIPRKGWAKPYTKAPTPMQKLIDT